MTGVSLAGFTTTALPAARAGATDRVERCRGQFPGLIMLTPPTRLRRTCSSLPRISVGRIGARVRYGVAVARSRIAWVDARSRFAFRRVLPAPRISQDLRCTAYDSCADAWKFGRPYRLRSGSQAISHLEIIAVSLADLEQLRSAIGISIDENTA